LTIKGLQPSEARSSIGYVPQNNQINWNFPLSVKQVVEMGLIRKNTFSPFSTKKNNKIVEESLSKVGLLERIDENINNLSGGQIQRVLLARTLTQGADILLLDEAFSAVDIGAEEDVMNIINDIKLDGKTILIATHDINNIKEKYDEVLCLNRHCCAFGDPSEVLTEGVIEEMYGSHNQILKEHRPGSHGNQNGN
jgi:ABC-type Mn2+/Zn2+ transport system ATPase subunit